MEPHGNNPAGISCCVCCRDRQRSVASFHQALEELQRSPLLAQAGVSVTAAEDTAGSELMAVATAAMAAMAVVATVEQHMQRHANGSGWHGKPLFLHAYVATRRLHDGLVT